MAWGSIFWPRRLIWEIMRGARGIGPTEGAGAARRMAGGGGGSSCSVRAEPVLPRRRCRGAAGSNAAETGGPPSWSPRRGSEESGQRRPAHVGGGGESPRSGTGDGEASAGVIRPGGDGDDGEAGARRDGIDRNDDDIQIRAAAWMAEDASTVKRRPAGVGGCGGHELPRRRRPQRRSRIQPLFLKVTQMSEFRGYYEPYHECLNFLQV
ncbi:Os12g0441200 [Oryza sativa Japonica Group]|uniref:Os12g0441200 protein n=1 Tax=Oryza sativa subsp. japonica TaxID=39947 RepID=Q0INJ9_ORYSJ|nr:Os12g0441200 [Oryza sativa Japonica Group]|eukprot:NP_001066697.2 Os12g0441200 [Oryza sativa Japonica Group]